MQLSVLKLTPLFLLIFTLISCDTEDPFAIPEPDFSSVPQPFEYEEAEPIEVEEGVTAYILDEGDGFASVVLRDQVSIHITVRTIDGEIIYSSSASNSQEPDVVNVASIERISVVRSYEQRYPAFTPGLKAGLLGMKEGERRTIIVSPEKGYQGVNESSYTHQFSEDTLQYDIVLSRISDS